MIPFSSKALGRSFLFPRTRRGTPSTEGHWKICWSWILATSKFPESALSITKTIADEVLQYLFERHYISEETNDKDNKEYEIFNL